MASSGEVEDRSSERSKVNCCCGPQPDKKPRRSCRSRVAQRQASQRAAQRQQATSVSVQPLGRVLRCARGVSDVLGVSQMCSEVLLAWVSQMCSDPICAGSEQAQTQISLRLRKHRGGACVIAHQRLRQLLRNFPGSGPSGRFPNMGPDSWGPCSGVGEDSPYWPGRA